MPIQVRCPNDCSLKFPSNRKGKIVVCEQCHASIRIPRTPTKNEKSKSIYEARLVADPGELDDSLSGVVSTNRSNPQSVEIDSSFNLDKPDQDSPSELISKPQRVKRRNKKDDQTKVTAQNIAAIDSTPQSSTNPFDFLVSEEATASIEVGNNFPITIDNVDSDQDMGDVMIEMDHQKAHHHDPIRDRVWLTRFYAVCLMIIGVINTVPVIAFLVTYEQQAWESTLPRWAFVSIFLALIFVTYSVYLLQLADWTSLLMVSIFVLAVACIYGFVAAGLWLGTSNGVIGRMLQLPESYYRFGPIWGGIMFCLLSLASFTFGRDAFSWWRSSKLRQLAS